MPLKDIPINQEHIDMKSNCDENGRITVLESEIQYTRTALDKLDIKMDKVLEALSRVEVLETKHSASTDSIRRAFTRIEDIEKRTSQVDSVLHENLNKLRGMTYLAWILWSGFGVILIALAVDRLTG